MGEIMLCILWALRCTPDSTSLLRHADEQGQEVAASPYSVLLSPRSCLQLSEVMLRDITAGSEGAAASPVRWAPTQCNGPQEVPGQLCTSQKTANDQL